MKFCEFFRRLFSLWGFGLAKTNPHRLKPVLLKSKGGVPAAVYE